MMSSSFSTVTFRRAGAGEDEAPSAPRLKTAALYDCANFPEVLADGWSTIEEGFVWSHSEEAVLRFTGLPLGDHLVRLAVDAFTRPERLPAQRVGVLVNDVDLGEVSFDGAGVLEFKLSSTSEAEGHVVRLRLPDAGKPCDVEPGNPDDRLLGIALRQVVIKSRGDGSSVSMVETDRTQWPNLSDEAKAELMKRFESLGENCEFGLVQRRCGAEPLGLLRFSSAPLSKLLAALEARFEGMGTRDNIHVELASNEREYMIQDRAFGFYYHAWVNAGVMAPEKIQTREAARVPFLVRKLCEDLTEGSKIFVFHAMDDMSTASALKLAAAIRRYGPGTLLWVRLSDTAHPPGSTERIADGLIAGYVDRFAPGSNAYDLSLDCWVEVCRSASERAREPMATPVKATRCVPPYALMDRWLTACTVPGTTRVRPSYDDVLDVLRAMIAIVPVNEEWYLTQYPDVVGFMSRLPDETATSHFRKHGYFNGRLPFADGWQGLRAPVRFTELTRNLRIVPARGMLYAEMEREDFLVMVRVLLRTLSVDELWYRKAYPEAANEIDATGIATAAEHYATSGYFKGWLPVDIDVDPDWYVARYGHVRNGLAAGVATSAKDHFLRIGYGEGCQPTPP
jgi:hypothetical protein